MMPKPSPRPKPWRSTSHRLTWQASSSPPPRHGLAAQHGEHTLQAWASELTKIAAEGLRRQALQFGHADEEPFLEPLFAILNRGTSPGSEAEAAAAENLSIPEFLKRYEY